MMKALTKRLPNGLLQTLFKCSSSHAFTNKYPSKVVTVSKHVALTACSQGRVGRAERPTDTFFDDVPDPYINDDLMVKLFQSMTLTGTPWEQFQQLVATAASMSQTAKTPNASLMNLGWKSIAERFIVPKTLPGLNLETGELLDQDQAATAQKRCEEWAKKN